MRCDLRSVVSDKRQGILPLPLFRGSHLDRGQREYSQRERWSKAVGVNPSTAFSSSCNCPVLRETIRLERIATGGSEAQAMREDKRLPFAVEGKQNSPEWSGSCNSRCAQPDAENPQIIPVNYRARNRLPVPFQDCSFPFLSTIFSSVLKREGTSGVGFLLALVFLLTVVNLIAGCQTLSSDPREQERRQEFRESKIKHLRH